MLLPYLRFHAIRLCRAYPIVVPLLLAASIAFVIAGSFYAEQRRQARFAFADLQRLQMAVSSMKARGGEQKAESQPGMDLPVFDSAALVQTLNVTAAETHLALEEVAYALDESSSEPYLRYRMTLRVAADYRTIRAFSARFTAELENVSLDAISCERKDVATVPLTCDLAFSAFYRRAPHG